MRAITLGLALVPLAACSGATSSEEENYYGEIAGSTYEGNVSSGDELDHQSFTANSAGSQVSGVYHDYEGPEEREPFDEDAARQAAERKLSFEGYDYSYGCTDDCSGHEAGWDWRADSGYSTYGNSQSFAEGGYAFDDALERSVDEMRDEYESGYDPDY